MQDMSIEYKYFSQRELTCKCGCGRQEMSPEFMYKIEAIREKLGFPFPVTSAYRCPEHNQKVSSSGPHGPHTTGRAIDISVRGDRAHALLGAAMEAGFSGIGVSQKGSARFIHLDDLTDSHPRPTVWSY